MKCRQRDGPLQLDTRLQTKLRRPYLQDMDSGFRGFELGLTAVLGEATIILSGLAPRFKFDAAPGFEPKPIGRPTVILLRVGKRGAGIAE